MPRFFFNISNSECLPGEEGSELRDLDAARAYAIEAARGILASDVRRGKLPLSLSFIVTDESGAVVFTFPFSEAVEVT